MTQSNLSTVKSIARGGGRGDTDPKVLAGSILVLADEIKELKKRVEEEK